MKKIVLIILLFATSAQLIAQKTFPASFEYSALAQNEGSTYSFNEKDEDQIDFKLIITGVDAAAKDLLNSCSLKLEGGGNAALISDLVKGDDNYYNSDKKTFTVRFDAPMAGVDFTINDNTTTLSVIKTDKKVVHSFTIKRIPSKKSPAKSLSKTEIQQKIQRRFETDYYGSNSQDLLNLTLERNALVDKNGIIHLFMDAYGKFYGPGIPTVAIQENRFQFHLLLTKEQAQNYAFDALYTGEYNPEILAILDTSKKNPGAAGGSNGDNKNEITRWDGAIKGPYTDNFSVEITRTKDDEVKKIVDATIRIAKLYHVSISTGLLYSSLRNPQNIETATLASGETTLIADDPRGRGVLTIMATYYPWGRSFLSPPQGGPFHRSRLGIQIGARLDDKIAENFFAGLSHDFARGGTISYGLHYGRRNYVSGKPDFDFGTEVFDLPELNIKQEWGVGIYVGVVIDTRVAVELIKSLGE